MLLRDFLNKKLYDKRIGYFAKQRILEPLVRARAPPAGRSGEPATRPFAELADKDEFLRHVHCLYGSAARAHAAAGEWHTPSTLFSPLYAQRVAQWAEQACASAAAAHNAKQPHRVDRHTMHIIEIGGGILFFLKFLF